MFDVFTCMLMAHTPMFQILMSLLACTQARIANTLQALTTRYNHEFTHEFLACSVLAGLNTGILLGWLSLLQNYDFPKHCGKSMTSFHTLCMYLCPYFKVIQYSYNRTRDANISSNRK